MPAGGELRPGLKALAVIPLPYDARTVFRIVSLVAQRWEAERGRTMPTTHLETQDTEFGRALVVWDGPVSEPAGGRL